MSERMQEIGAHLLWLLGHALFTTITICAMRGGYALYQDYKALQPVEFNLAALSPEDKEQLAQALVEDGYNVPRPEGRKKG